MNYILQIPPLMWQQFCQAMQQARTENQEVIGFFFCKHYHINRQIRYAPQAWVVPTPDCYECQSVDGLILKQQFHFYLLESYIEPGLDVVHIHTHPGQEMPVFSTIDDDYESKYAQFLATRFSHKPHLISGIFDESFQQSQFRIWDETGTTVQPVEFYHTWLMQTSTKTLTEKTESMFARQNIFGETFQKQLGELTVTLVGCGGIGAIFAELLGRLGVRKWVLIDPDTLETSNLNRMPGATWEMVNQLLPKVEYVRQLIEVIYPTDAEIQTLPTSVENVSSLADCATSDLIVVATDNHYSRQIAQEIALQFMRPLICLGTHIEVKSNHSPRMYCRITIPPLGGGWCLMCGNIINLQTAALESAPQEIEQLATQRGYLDKIPNPAVFWLNSICASTAVGILQGIISGFLNVDSGLDWIYEFPESRWHKADTNYLMTSDCYFCGSEYI
ncbi:MAG: ThiF family adenylyltransferase [Microcoleaceae cyanobacterium]